MAEHPNPGYYQIDVAGIVDAHRHGLDCPVPLTGVYSRDCYADGQEKDWLLVTANPHSTAAGFATTTPCGRMSRNCIGR